MSMNDGQTVLRPPYLSGLTDQQYQELKDYIFGQIQHRQRLSLSALHTILYSFGKNHSLAAMYGYLKWCKDNKETDSAIMETITHDLAGRGDEGFSPRTWGYLKYYQEKYGGSHE